MVMTTIPKSFQDYDDDDPDINKRQTRWDYWNALKSVRKEYLTDNKEFDAYEFEDFLTEQYGIRMHLFDGKITDGFEIVDEKKYLIFLLKHK
jgi:hypothetical protein